MSTSINSCPHVSETKLPSSNTSIYKDECGQCFIDQDSELGINVCLTCFVAGCGVEKPHRHHARKHFISQGHPIAMNIRRSKVNNTKEERPKKITRLAIPAEEEPQYLYSTQFVCFHCDKTVDENCANLKDIKNAILNSLSATKKQEIKSWEVQVVSCQHIESLVQQKHSQQNLTRCNDCDLKENLWLCLVCGNLGCGRQQFGGVGGNGHGLSHFEATGHGVACKLGTITPEGTADIYCYTCDDERLDPLLATHLGHFGINIATQEKTEKSLTELQLEQNMKFDFSMTTEDGKHMTPVNGPGLTGIKNLGNSCYMASVLQVLFSIDEFKKRYFENAVDHHVKCPQAAPTCFHCQMSKMAEGLCGGDFSIPVYGPEGDIQGQKGIHPAMYKNLIGHGHPEFSSMRQQDSFEFLQYLMDMISRKEKSIGGIDPTKTFNFNLEQRLQCQNCQKVRYAYHDAMGLSLPVPAIKNDDGGYDPITLYDCMNKFTSPEDVEMNCPTCHSCQTFTKTNRMATFPEHLCINVNRFILENWVPKKLVVNVTVPEGLLDVSAFQAFGKQEQEESLPEESVGDDVEVPFNESDIQQLMSMGFSRVRCEKALINTQHSGAELAMEWLFQHMEDPDIDVPLPPKKNEGGIKVPEELIQNLVSMGFTTAQATKALKHSKNNMEMAVDYLFSNPDDQGEEQEQDHMQQDATLDKVIPPELGGPAPTYSLVGIISHKGPSTHCGHYVAYVLHGDRWILFNDAKVVHAPDPDTNDAYVFVFQRI